MSDASPSSDPSLQSAAPPAAPSARGLTPASADQLEQFSVQAPLMRAVEQGALGLVCTRSFPAIIGTADAMLKSSGITLVGYEKTGSGYCTAVVRGGYSDVKIAVEVGKKTAQQFEQYVSSMMLPRPWPNLDVVLPISTRFAAYAEGRGGFDNTGAIGLIETRGFPAMVGASDAMMKCANVELITYETTGSGLCTAVVQGNIGDVTMAIEAGMNEAERIGELHAIMVIPRPLDDLMQAMPQPKRRALEQPLPPLEEKPAIALELEPERIALPELEERVLEPVELQSGTPQTESQALELSPPPSEAGAIAVSPQRNRDAIGPGEGDRPSDLSISSSPPLEAPKETETPEDDQP
jgi:carbon dioxide concentrating mechanism protein CcmO